ncbi:MAG: NACHT domain-containing protein [Snowella sp.]|nr:NACHT domain-containing protein [Snowella sp.]
MSPRKRGIAPTATGQQKLLALKAAGRGDGQRFTYEAIAEHIFQKTSVSIEAKTVNRFFRGEGIDRDSVTAICQGLDLEIIEIVEPNEWYPPKLPQSEPQEAINWSAICRQQNAKLRRSPTEEGFEPEIFVPLGLMERKQQQRRPLNQEMGMDQVYGVEEKAEVTRKFEHQEFLTYIGLGGKKAENTKNVAIIGEPGAGKTTLLANLAEVIDENKELAIAISLGSFGAWQSLEPKRNLRDYLEQKWLEDALPDQNVSETERLALADRFRQGGVWLLLDGLDEMQASSPVEALAQIEKEVRSGYLQKARVVLTCRVNVWDANLTNPLREFETYKTLDFAEGQRDDFIGQWFTKKGNLALGEGLINQLKESGRERLCELVKNPLRLVLLCYIWTQQAGELPETKAQFYQRYLRYFYEWKKEVQNLTGKRQQQAQLHQALGRLAIAGIESSSRYRLSESLAVQEMGEDCFQLAVDLGWLNIVDREQGTDEAVYAFFHPTFQEFFAACGVEDWDFFLPCNHVDRPVEGKVYRIFEAKWKEVILLWLGRGDITELDKENFIKKIMSFQDNCGGFYRTYFIAAAGISEFKACSLADQIITTIIQWSFGYFDKTKEDWVIFLNPFRDFAKQSLLETEKSKTIPKLVEIINSSKDFINVSWQATEILSKIDQRHSDLIDLLIKFIHESHDESIRRKAGITLENLTENKEEVTDAIIKLIEKTCYKDTRTQAIEILAEIGLGSKKIFIYLAHLIRTTSDDNLYCEAIKALGKICQDNIIDEILKVLSEVISSSKENSSHLYVIKTLESIYEKFTGNFCIKQKIIKLISKIACILTNDFLLIETIEFLGKINEDNQDYINQLKKIIYTTESNNVCEQALKSLKVIDFKKKELINILKDLLNNIKYKQIYPLLLIELSEIDPLSIETVCFLCDWVKTEKSKLIIIAILKSLRKSELNHKYIIETLNNLNFIHTLKDDLTRLEIIDILGNLDSSGLNSETMLIQLSNAFLDENIRLRAVEILQKHYPFNPKIKTILIRLIHDLKNDNFRLRAAEILFQNHTFDSEIETMLIQFIEISNNKSICLRIFKLSEINCLQSLQIAKTLIKITYGEEESIVWKAMKILENFPKYPEIITRLNELMNKTYHEYTRLQSVKNLFLIDPLNQNILNTFIDILITSEDDFILRESYDIFKRLNDYDLFLCVIKILKNNLLVEHSQTNFVQFSKCCHLIWHCAQTLSYPEFYQAWHHPPITPHPEVLDTTPIGSTATTQTLNLQLLPNELPTNCLYLNAQPFNPYSLPELSQELCNLIHQHLNQYPIPEANNLPQLKRHLLPLLAQHPQLTLIFGNAYPSDTLLTFCQQLNATIAIAWINDQAIPNLQTFPPKTPTCSKRF